MFKNGLLPFCSKNCVPGSLVTTLSVETLGTASDLNKKAKTFRFAAGVTGGAAGEAFVADVEDIGSLGDAFEAGPTQLTEVTDEGGREDAGRKLLTELSLGLKHY